MKLSVALLAGWVMAVTNTLAASEDVAAGWESYRLGEFATAIKHFERAKDNPAALYGLATTWDWRRPGENRAKAAALYRQVLATAPQSEWAPWSLLALARQPATLPPGKEPPLTELLAGYQAVIDRFPNHPAGEEAFLFQQAAQLVVPGKTTAPAVVAALEKFLRDRPRSPYRSAAWGLVAHGCERLGESEKQLAAAIQEWRTAEIDPLNPSPNLAWTYWRIATLAEFAVGDFAVAREYYGKLIAEYPTEQRVFLAKQELRRMEELETQLRRQ